MQQAKQLGPYLLRKTLGEGTFAKVKLATHQPTNESVAIKILNKTKITDVSDVERINREIHILKLVRHSNIIQLYQIIETPKHLFFVMEYCENGELFKYITDKRKLKQQEACKLYQQLISGLEYLHKLHISHRDLKTQNLLLDHQMNLKIVDFGLANTYKKQETLRTPCGSQVYAAPQILQAKSYSGEMVDIWSSGIILFAMVCGYLPFQDDNHARLTQKIVHGKYSLPSCVSPQLKDLLQKILTKNPDQRYTIQKIRSHPWMNKNLSINSTRNKGIVVGYNKIPIDTNVIKMMGSQYNPEYVCKCLQANRHNNITTVYYLTLKKYIKSGGNSSSDLSSKHFNPHLLKSSSRSKQNIKKQISVLEQNKQNIPLNNEKIQIELIRKSGSKKTSISLNQSKLNNALYTKQSSATTTHKLIKPSKLNKLNQSIVGKAIRDKSKSVDKSQRFSVERLPMNKRYISIKPEKRTKKSQNQERNKSTMINQSFMLHHQRQKSVGQIKKKLNDSILNRPSLNPKKKR